MSNRNFKVALKSSDSELLRWLHNADRHPDLERAGPVKDAIYTVWRLRQESFNDGKLSATLAADGVLSAFGYSVGDFGLRNPEERQRILNLVLEAHLPPLVSPSYLQEWGMPNSEKRREKLMNVFSSLAFGASQMRGKHKAARENAISDWNTDLEYIVSLKLA